MAKISPSSQPNSSTDHDYKNMAGQYVRKTYTFRPDQLDAIVQIAKEVRLSQNDVVRWFIDIGLKQVSEGATPPVKDDTVKYKYNPNQ